jgi:hypothetical protein
MFPESRMREIRPSGLMRGGECSGDTDNVGQFNHLTCTLCLLYPFSAPPRHFQARREWLEERTMKTPVAK